MYPPCIPCRAGAKSGAGLHAYQAISGAGKTFATWPEMVDNVIPYIGGKKKNPSRSR